MTNFIDCRDGTLENETRYLIVTQERETIIATYVENYLQQPGNTYWVPDDSEGVLVEVGEVTHYAPLELPPLRTRGPFRVIQSESAWTDYAILSYDDDKERRRLPYSPSSVEGFVDWLNRIWAKKGEGKDD